MSERSPDDYVSDIEFTRAECDAVGATYLTDAPAVDQETAAISSQTTTGTCVFQTLRQKLIGEMFVLLYGSNVTRVTDDPEVLELKVPQDSPTSVDQTFETLKYGAATMYGTNGYWRGMTEETRIMEVVFFDSPDNSLSRRLINTVERLGEELSPAPGASDRPGEYVMLATVIDIESSSIEPDETQGSFPSEQMEQRLDGVFPLPPKGDERL